MVGIELIRSIWRQGEERHCEEGFLMSHLHPTQCNCGKTPAAEVLWNESGNGQQRGMRDNNACVRRKISIFAIVHALISIPTGARIIIPLGHARNVF